MITYVGFLLAGVLIGIVLMGVFREEIMALWYAFHTFITVALLVVGVCVAAVWVWHHTPVGRPDICPSTTTHVRGGAPSCLPSVKPSPKRPAPPTVRSTLR